MDVYPVNALTKGSLSAAWCPSDSKPQALRQWSRPYFFSLVGLALLWEVENFLVQAAAIDLRPTTIHPYCYQAGRFGLNFLAASSVVLFF